MQILPNVSYFNAISAIRRNRSPLSLEVTTPAGVVASQRPHLPVVVVVVVASSAQQVRPQLPPCAPPFQRELLRTIKKQKKSDSAATGVDLVLSEG